MAAVLFWRLLPPTSQSAIKKAILRLAEQEGDRPTPDTRQGLALIALTTPDIKEPTKAELNKAYSLVVSLLTEKEYRQVAEAITNS